MENFLEMLLGGISGDSSELVPTPHLARLQHESPRELKLEFSRRGFKLRVYLKSMLKLKFVIKYFIFLL